MSTTIATVSGLVTTSAWTVAAILVVTYLVSTAQGALAVRKKEDGGSRPPPMLPYAVPLIGHVPEFAWNIERFLTKATTQYGRDIPVRIRLLNRRMSILKGPGNIMKLFKSSRGLSSEPWLVQVLVNAFGVEVADTPFYLTDNTGLNAQPDPGSNDVSPEHRIFHLVYKSTHDGLSGARLAEMERQVVNNLSKQMAEVDVRHDEWTDLPDLYGGFIRDMCFRAAVTSLCGSEIGRIIPTLVEDFWHFDKHLPNLFKEMPRWLVPASFEARDRMKAHMQTWHDHAHAHYDVTKSADDERDWEEYFGSRLMRTRNEFFQKMPLSKETIAADDLGLLWGSTANAIPAIGWMILEVLQRPDILARAREEIAPYVSRSPSNPANMVVDIDGLCKQTLLQSIYAEVLRFHNGTVINRVPRSPRFTIGGWHFRKDEPIIISTYNTARDNTVWNEGTDDEPHPVDEFWPERFIIDPSKPGSGPIRHQKQREGASSAGNGGPTFSLSGTDGSWVPYGGGSRMCPGRHFAKRELIVSLALFLSVFDVELKTDPSKFLEHDESYFMFGVMHPKGAVPARIRRRKF